MVTADLDERIEKCNRILESDPNSQIFAALADALRKRGDFERAFRVCQNGLRIHPSYGSAHVVMAKINLDRGLYDWAEAEAKKAIELEGASRAIELLLAEIYIYKGEFNSAVKLLRKLNTADPANEQIKKLLEIALRIPQEQAASMAPERRPLQSTPMPVASEDRTIVEKHDRAHLSAKQIVRQAMTIVDLQGAMFINAEGLAVEAEWTLTIDAATAAATMFELDKQLTHELLKSSFGQGRALLVECAGPVWYLVHVVNGAFLFVCDKRINLGTLRMRVANLTDRYLAA